MGLLDIFKKDNADKNLESRALFYHEDDYCQVELSPNENLFLFKKELGQINDLAEKSFDGSGYTDIYVRRDNRLKLEERKINPDALENVIKNIGVEKANTVTTGYGSTHREIRNNTVGYGKDYSAFYFDFKDNIVGHIWLTNSFGIDKIKLTECLFEIGQLWNLILVDWSQSEIVNLKDKSAIEKYLDA